MDMEKAKRVVGDILDRQAQELQQIASKKSWSASDYEVQEKLLKNMKEAACIMEMAEQGSSGRSGRRGYSRGYSGEGYSQGGNYSGYGSSGRGYSGEEGYSERSRGSNGQYRSGENYSGHSIEDRMIANLEEMAGRAGSPYEQEKIQQGLDALRRIFN